MTSLNPNANPHRVHALLNKLTNSKTGPAGRDAAVHELIAELGLTPDDTLPPFIAKRGDETGGAPRANVGEAFAKKTIAEEPVDPETPFGRIMAALGVDEIVTDDKGNIDHIVFTDGETIKPNELTPEQEVIKAVGEAVAHAVLNAVKGAPKEKCKLVHGSAVAEGVALGVHSLSLMLSDGKPEAVSFGDCVALKLMDLSPGYQAAKERGFK